MALALAALVLTACATNEGFRDPDARISATTRFDPARMQGAWQVQERVASAEDPAAHAPESYVYGAVNGARFDLTRNFQTCSETGCAQKQETLTAQMVAPGRYQVTGGAEHWVLWADADYRVAAIGTPSGEFGWIMTQGDARGDLMQAAREIMDWNGYDLSRLQGVDKQ